MLRKRSYTVEELLNAPPMELATADATNYATTKNKWTRRLELSYPVICQWNSTKATISLVTCEAGLWTGYDENGHFHEGIKLEDVEPVETMAGYLESVTEVAA